MVRVERIPGVRLAPLGAIWAAFSPASGETALLNDESAAILEVLESGSLAPPEVCRLIAQDCGQAIDDVAGLIAACWPRLIEAGLVQATYDSHGATP